MEFLYVAVFSLNNISFVCQQTLERNPAATGSCQIYFLIAGTYTPFLLTNSRTKLGWIVFGIVWGLSIVGLVLKLAFSDKFEKPTVWLYLLMGWAGMVVFFQTRASIGTLTIVFY